MVRRFLLGIGPALVLVACLCVNPVPTVPEFVQAPGIGYLRTTSEFRLTASWARGDSLKLIISWGDQSSEASESFAQGDTISMYHEWKERGYYWVRAMSLASDDPGLSSEWSEFQGIEILSAAGFPNPSIGVVRPIPWKEVTFWVTAAGGESDSFSFQVDFKDGLSDWTDYVASSELYIEGYRLLLEVLGAPGILSRESPGAVLQGKIEASYRNGLILTFGGGTNEVQRDIIAMAGMGMPHYKD